jgi:organic radical activating enzyme
MKERIRLWYERIFPTMKPIPGGTYHYQSPPDAPKPLRIHLRIEPDGSGLLLLNASTVLHLNQTAAEFAYHFVKQTPDAEVIHEINRRYRIPNGQAEQDYIEFKQRLDSLITTPDLDPETFLGYERSQVHTQRLSAPIRLDCALTYKTTSGDGKHVAPVERVRRELRTEEWTSIFDKAWQAGIPHLVLTGGEPTLRPDLPELIAYAEKLGQVTGLITDGTRLSEKDYIHQLLVAGLDHIMIVISEADESWEGLRDVLTEDVFTAIHLTVTERNAAQLPELIEKLARLGANGFSLSASSPALKDALQAARDAVARQGLPLVWDLPVPYSSIHPVALELAEGEEVQLGGAGRSWLYVEPDGDVLPGQGIQKVLGSILTDPWEQIWDAAKKLE